jgi:serine/threonine-protein kinase
VFVVHTNGEHQNEIHAGSLDGTHHLILHADTVAGLARGCLLFIRDGALYAQPFNEKKLALEGKPRRIIDGIVFVEANAWSPVWVGADGAIAYVPYAPRRSVGSWHDRTGRNLGQVYQDTDLGWLSIARDGTKIAVLKLDPAKGAKDIHTIDLVRGVRTRVTGGLSDHDGPIWSPAGDRVYFSSDRTGLYDLYSQVEDGTAPAQLVWTSAYDKWVSDVTPDGKSLLVTVYRPETENDIWLAPAAGGGAPRALIASEADENYARLSPDGRWLAYMSDRSGRGEIYVRRFPDGHSVQASTEGGTRPVWNHNGTELVFLAPGRIVSAVAVAFNGDTPVPGKPQHLFPLEASETAAYPSPIDDRLLVTSIPDALDQMSIVNYIRREW